jgi:hypothetical protein
LQVCCLIGEECCQLFSDQALQQAGFCGIEIALGRRIAR